MILTTAQGTINTGYSGSQQPIIQNLGPGNLYIGTTNNDLASNGLFLAAGAVYEFPATLVEGGNAVYLLASGGNCDVRILNVG
jgi:hypothetical protein